MRAISVVAPAVNDVDKAERMLLSALGKAQFPERVEVMIYVPEWHRDYDQITYLCDNVYKELENVLFLYSEDDITISESYNCMANNSCGDIVVIGDETMVFKSMGWDSILEMNADFFPDDIFCLKIGMTAAISKKWVQVVEKLCPSLFHHSLTDAWILDVGGRINRIQEVDKVQIKRRLSLNMDHSSKGVLNWNATDKIREGEARKLKKYMSNAS